MPCCCLRTSDKSTAYPSFERGDMMKGSRRKIGNWVLAGLLIVIAGYAIFFKITSYTRSSSDDMGPNTDEIQPVR